MNDNRTEKYELHNHNTIGYQPNCVGCETTRDDFKALATVDQELPEEILREGTVRVPVTVPGG